jgi:DNA-binding protein H-NS
MAKRGRKPTDTPIAAMSIDALFKLRDEVADAISNRASELRKQLAHLTSIEAMPARKSKMAGRKVAPQFRSKKDPNLIWSGRGQVPRWMKEEMKGTKLTKESFRIE